MKDLPALVALYAQLHPGEEHAPEEQLASVFAEILSSRYFEVVVAEVEGSVVGSCYLNVIPNLTRGAKPYAIVENVVTTAELRNRGVGKAVVGFALSRAWERGCYKVMLQTGSKSEAKHGFYRRCGFSQTEKLAFVARPNNVVANPSIERTASGVLCTPAAAAHVER